MYLSPCHTCGPRRREPDRSDPFFGAAWLVLSITKTLGILGRSGPRMLLFWNVLQHQGPEAAPLGNATSPNPSPQLVFSFGRLARQRGPAMSQQLQSCVVGLTALKGSLSHHVTAQISPRAAQDLGLAQCEGS